MTRPKHFNINSKIVRDSLLRATELSDKILNNEKKLVIMLYNIDQQRFYVRFGYKSLMGFCCHGLKLSKTQSQRIVTTVRRYEPTSNIGIKTHSSNVGHPPNMGLIPEYAL